MIILDLLSSKRKDIDFLYYASTQPGNPLNTKPLINLENGMYQVFEVKQVIHAIEGLLETLCTQNQSDITKFSKRKGKLLEDKTSNLFLTFFGEEAKIYTEYYVDGCEQDILVLWKQYAFIIETKGYLLKEPFRDPNKAYERIKRDFHKSLGNAYEQTKRVEQKFVNGEVLKITTKDGKLIEEIDTTQFEYDFSILVNREPFGQIQCDLSLLLGKDDDDVYPWAIKFDDLEVFLLTLKAKEKSPAIHLINFLLMREELHGRIYCSDELQICGAFLHRELTLSKVEKTDHHILTTPDATAIFDTQY